MSEWKMISPDGKEENADIRHAMKAMSDVVTGIRERQRHRLLLDIQQRTDLEPISSEEVMLLVAQLVTDGSFIDSNSIHDITNHPSVSKEKDK
jgi:hypothetical protein